ncbi:MAG: acyl-CoA thioesterase domain-containing protein [Dehalococcoidia bacterium]
MPANRDPVAEMIATLDVQPTGPDEFSGRTSVDDQPGYDRAFGGDLLGQATVASGRTVPGAMLHSLHAYFLRPGRAGAPVTLRVERVRDGRSFAHRRVRVEQGTHLLCDVAANFVLGEGVGVAYQETALDAPDPETLPDLRNEPGADQWAFEWRHVDDPATPVAEGEPAIWRVWMRPNSPLPDDPLLHIAAAVQMSDAGAFGAVERRFEGGIDWSRSASLDHAIWFHRPLRWDGWLLVHTESPVAHGGRALMRRSMFTPDGALVASVVQEALFRGHAARPAR